MTDDAEILPPEDDSIVDLRKADLTRMRTANQRFAAAVEEGDVTAALSADDDFHGVAVEASGNRAVATVLAQFSPVVRRLERRRFASHAGAESVALHERLVEACANGDAEAAAQVAFRTWQNLADLIPGADQPTDQPSVQTTDQPTDQQETS
jgi:DNA-binding GntR family transcriptional regulator